MEGLLKANGVDLAFTGHAHIYERNRASAAGAADRRWLAVAPRGDDEERHRVGGEIRRLHFGKILEAGAPALVKRAFVRALGERLGVAQRRQPIKEADKDFAPTPVALAEGVAKVLAAGG